MEEVLIKINQLYGIRVSSFEKVTKGFLSDNYFVSDGKTRFFLKKYRFDNSDRIIEVHAAKKHFTDGGIPVILPLALLNGETFFEHQGAYFALFPFVDGRHIERGDLTESAIVSLGKMLARIHLVGKESKLGINEHLDIQSQEKTHKKIEDILAKISEITTLSAFDKAVLANVQMKQTLLLKNTMAFDDFGLHNDHLIHGDYLDHNVFFDENDDVKWVFDFEKTGYAPRAYELFRSMGYSLFSPGSMGIDLKNARTYLDAYASIYPISKDEIMRGLQLYFTKTIHGFWVESEHYLNNNTRVDHFLFDDYKRIKYFSENLDTLVEVLTK